jgi:hypothetical protein
MAKPRSLIVGSINIDAAAFLRQQAQAGTPFRPRPERWRTCDT